MLNNVQKQIRLDKYLADMGLGTRSKVKSIIRNKRVKVDGNIIISPEHKVNENSSEVYVDGRPLIYKKYGYYLLNKPAGCVSAGTDRYSRTVFDCIDDDFIKNNGFFSVGRLDKDTEGLLIITNDGKFSHNLLSPSKHVEKEYYVETDEVINDGMREIFERGIDIGDDKPTLPAILNIIGTNCARVIINEGRFHQIKRMFAAAGVNVTYLKRIRMGTLKLDENLEPGEYRELTPAETDALKNPPEVLNTLHAAHTLHTMMHRHAMLDGIDAVIFDLDGTLVDSMWIWHEIDVEYLGKFGIDIPEGLQHEIEGMSFNETAIYFKERFNISDDIEKIKSDWNDMAFDIYKNKIELKEAAAEFLRYIKNHNIRTAIATSNSRILTETVLQSLNISEYFDVIVTSCEVCAGKPAPDVYLEAAGRLGVECERCLVFEDIPKGIMAGKNAGMKVCAVWDRYSEIFREEKEILADYYIDSFKNITENAG